MGHGWEFWDKQREVLRNRLDYRWVKEGGKRQEKGRRA